MTLAAMTFSSEATYLEQMRNMLQMQQRSAGLILPPEIPTMERYDSQDSQRSSLAKLLHSNANVLSSGSTVTSVIHSVPSHRVFSPDLRMPPALTTYEDGPDPRSKLNGFDDSLPGITVARRFSASLGSGGSSNISPASGSNEHDEQAESPSGKIPSGLIQTTDITGEDSLPPVSPKSESNDSASSERSYTNNNNNPKFQYSHLLQQHLLQRNSSLLQYCLTTPQEPHDRDGGSDAEAEHTSNSPDSSDLQESTTPPPGHDFQCQICDFHSPSKFHYNSHMNTHSVHRCPIQDCNYSTRTEGRLRRHVKGHHQSSRDSSVGDDFKGFGEESPKKSSEGGTPRGSISLQGSGGKAKTYRCKQCDFVALTKAEYFGHARMHIKPEKQLLCPIEGCPFVTEYKHHLEYHSRNHTGSKPFKCPQPNCSYTCVNKSMLNSHMKSHSNFYQYRCDCGYVTKYCHSLKLHLKKYHGHKAINNGPEAAQLTMATSSQPAPTPSPIKVEEKPAKRRRNANKNASPSQQPAVNHMNGGFSGYTVGGGPSVSMSDGTPVTIPGAFPYGLYPGVGALNQFHAASIYNNLLLNGLMNPGARMNGFGGRANAASPEVKRESPSPSESESHFDPNSANLQELVNRENNGVLRMLPQSRNIRSLNEVVNNGTPLDLSGGKENGADGRSESPKSDGSSANAASEVLSSRRRRKGPAFKIDAAIRQRLQDPIPEEEDAGFGTDLVNEHQNEKCPIIHPESPPAAFVHATGFRQIGSDSPAPKAGRVSGTVKRPHPDSSGVNAANGTKFPKREFSCEYCAMGFEDSTMYTMHMGFHGRDDPYTCASCGHSAVDRLSFFLHIARAPHA